MNEPSDSKAQVFSYLLQRNRKDELIDYLIIRAYNVCMYILIIKLYALLLIILICIVYITIASRLIKLDHIINVAAWFVYENFC